MDAGGRSGFYARRRLRQKSLTTVQYVRSPKGFIRASGVDYDRTLRSLNNKLKSQGKRISFLEKKLKGNLGLKVDLTEALKDPVAEQRVLTSYPKFFTHPSECYLKLIRNLEKHHVFGREEHVIQLFIRILKISELKNSGVNSFEFSAFLTKVIHLINVEVDNFPIATYKAKIFPELKPPLPCQFVRCTDDVKISCSIIARTGFHKFCEFHGELQPQRICFMSEPRHISEVAYHKVRAVWDYFMPKPYLKCVTLALPGGWFCYDCQRDSTLPVHEIKKLVEQTGLSKFDVLHEWNGDFELTLAALRIKYDCTPPVTFIKCTKVDVPDVFPDLPDLEDDEY